MMRGRLQGLATYTVPIAHGLPEVEVEVLQRVFVNVEEVHTASVGVVGCHDEGFGCLPRAGRA